MSALQQEREVIEHKLTESVDQLYALLRKLICQSIYPGAIFHDQS